MSRKSFGALYSKDNIVHFGKTLKYSLYILTHPLDGFWDLTHEKRGSIAAANFIVVLTALTMIWKLQFTNFQFNKLEWEYVNIFMEIASFLLPLAIWCIANWALTTLFDGKGTLKKVYMGTAYALTPYPLIQLPLILISNIVTYKEGEFYEYFSALSIIWFAALLISAMMMIHEYTLGKTILCMIASIFGMMVIIFILMLFFSLLSDGIAYFVSLYKEIVFRMY